MSLTTELLKSDAGKLEEKQTGTYYSKRLARLLGKGEPVPVTYTEISLRRLQDLTDMYSVNGTISTKDSYEMACQIVAESVVEPDLTDKDLKDHFGCSLAKELAEKLFGIEVGDISDGVAGLISGETKKVEEVKN